jgi:hypothetical protein
MYVANRSSVSSEIGSSLKEPNLDLHYDFNADPDNTDVHMAVLRYSMQTDRTYLLYIQVTHFLQQAILI